MKIRVATSGDSIMVELIEGETVYKVIEGYENVLLQEEGHERVIKLSDLRVVFDPHQPNMEHG
jgi:hypothetical protein